MKRLLLMVALMAGVAAQAQHTPPTRSVTIQLGKGQVPADVRITKRRTNTSKLILVTVNPDTPVKILEFTEMHSGLHADLSQVTAAMMDPGFSVERVRATTELPSVGNGREGSFRTSCFGEGTVRGPVRYAFDDPIAFPGQPGRSHLHTFFGNAGADAHSTTESLEATGNSNCRGGTINRSAYWVSTLLDLRTHQPVPIDRFIAYYKTSMDGWTDASGTWVPDSPQNIVQELPKGLRMIAGTPTRNTPRQPEDAFDHRWTCLNPASTFYTEIPHDCAGVVLQEILYPMCWDGKNLDSPDHKSHMSYATHTVPNRYPDGRKDPRDWSHRVCPPTHPVKLPTLAFNVGYKVTTPGQAKNWALSCDQSAVIGEKHGFCSHGDWWNGWKEQPFVEHCLRAMKDCHAHLLGDGRAIF